MFAYCNNNPVNYADPNGNFPWLVVGIIAVCVIVGGIVGYNSDEKLWESPDKQDNSTNNKLPSQDFGNEQNQDTDIMQKTSTEVLTTNDRIKNTLLGASFGVAAGGLIVATGGAVGSVAVGSATTYITAFGATGIQTFAIGALTYDVWALVIAPFLGIELEPIEYAP